MSVLIAARSIQISRQLKGFLLNQSPEDGRLNISKIIPILPGKYLVGSEVLFIPHSSKSPLWMKVHVIYRFEIPNANPRECFRYQSYRVQLKRSTTPRIAVALRELENREYGR